jgi:hypothetical protein
MHTASGLGIAWVCTTATFSTFSCKPTLKINCLRREKTLDQGRIREVGLRALSSAGPGID